MHEADITDDQWMLSVLPLQRRVGNSDGKQSKHTNPAIDMGNGSQCYDSYHTSNEKVHMRNTPCTYTMKQCNLKIKCEYVHVCVIVCV